MRDPIEEFRAAVMELIRPPLEWLLDRPTLTLTIMAIWMTALAAGMLVGILTS